MQTRFERNVSKRKTGLYKSVLGLALGIGIISGVVSIQAQYAEAVSKNVAYDGRGGYFAQVKAKSTIYGKVNEDEASFCAVIANEKQKFE